jgi:hypothetical protein
MKIFCTTSRMSASLGALSTELLEHFIALVQDEELHLVQLERLSSDQRKEPSRSANQDVRRGRLEHLLLLEHRLASIDHLGLHSGHVFREAVELLLDLVGQLVSVADHKGRDWVRLGVQTVEDGQDEDGGLAHAGLGLSQDIGPDQGLGETLLLNCNE